MPYKVNLPPFGAVGHVYGGSPFPEKAETAETTETKLAATSVRRELAGTVPADAVLLAPRYNGGAPLVAVPTCWCCDTPYRLQRVEKWQRKSYAFLEPDCGCLDAPQALACCGLCVEHCRCNKGATDGTTFGRK